MDDRIPSTEYNFISFKSIIMDIYFWTFLNTIKLFSSVKFPEPNNKFSIETTVYDVRFIHKCNFNRLKELN
jgi:hypothetical protein